MLLEWRRFIEEVDPDVVIGYNIANFDLPYLMDRAKALKAGDFPYLGRLKRVKTEVKDTHFSSKAYGNRDSKETKMDGRLQLDLLQVMHRDYKLRSYTLNSVCAHFLGEVLQLRFSFALMRMMASSQANRRKMYIIRSLLSYKMEDQNRVDV